jgi:hypothetical protein
MSPEFVAIFEEREQLGRWFILLPICLGFLALIVSAVKSRKGIAFLYITLLAIASVAIPTLMGGLWWDELSDVATSHEETEWIFNHDGGGLLIAPLYATLLATVFWIIAVLVLFIRIVIARMRKSKKTSNILTPGNYPGNRMQSDAAKPRR